MEENKQNGTFFTNVVFPAIIVFAGILLLAIFIFIMPENRIKRASKAADRYYSSGKYYNAFSKYSSILEIDQRNVKALNRMVLCAQQLEDIDEYEVFAEAREYISELDYSYLSTEDKAYITDMYLLTSELIEDEDERVAVLLEGYTFLQRDISLEPAISDTYLILAKKAESSDVMEALELYEKAAKFSNNSETVMEAATEIFEEAINLFAAEENFDETLRILDSYGEYLPDKGEAARTYCESLKGIGEVENRFLSQVYEVMAEYYAEANETFALPDDLSADSLDFGMLAKNWDKLLELCESEDAKYLTGTNYRQFIYAPEGADEEYYGVGCGMFGCDRDENGKYVSYSFYMGDFEGGERSGYGINFVKTGENSFEAYEGMFLNDMANGEGIYYRVAGVSDNHETEYKSVSFGIFEDGEESGDITVWQLSDN